MKLHRFARLRLRPALIGWITIVVAALWFVWDVLLNGDFIVAKWPGKPMPFEMWILAFGLGWLAFVAFWPELDQAERPDLALVWDASPEAKTVASRNWESAKVFVMHNRSSEWIHNAEVHPIGLADEMTFDKVNEIGPNEKIHVVARWNGKSSIDTQLAMFLCEGKNELAARKRGWQITKDHNRGISPTYLKIPMRITYNAKDRAWQAKFNLHYDPGGGSEIETLAKRRI